MRTSKTLQKAVTPSSVKILMIVEAGIIGFLCYWVLNEYTYNAYFRVYADQVLLSHVTTYSAILGLGIGLAGSAAAAVLYKNLQHAKYRLETVVAPKIRGAVDKVMPGVPGVDAPSPTSLGMVPNASEQTMVSSNSSPAAETDTDLEEIDEKKSD